MSMDPFHRFLGVGRSSDAATLLGLQFSERTPIRIDEALLRQLQRVASHSDGRSDEAEQVKSALRNAADALKQQWRAAHGRANSPAPARITRSVATSIAPAVKLTAFDRQVLAALVAGGGWNSQTRAQLVALAAAYNVSADGLMRVIRGLSDYARSGGPQLSISQITAGADRVNPPPASVDQTAAPSASWLRRMAPELRGEAGVWGTARLAGLLSLLVVSVGIWLLFSVTRTDQGPDETGARHSATAPTFTTTPNLPERRIPAAPDDDRPVEALQVNPWPTFRGEPRPLDTEKAMAQMDGLADALETLARSLLISAEPTERMLRDWSACVDPVATCWPLLDDAELKGLEDRFAEVIAAAGTRDAALNPLLDALAPEPIADDAAAVWRNAWKCAMLGSITAESDLPEATIRGAKSRLAHALGGSIGSHQIGRNESAMAWLLAQVPNLARATSQQQSRYDSWEAWIRAMDQFAAGPRRDEAIFAGVKAILARREAIENGHPALNVLGRLLEEVDLTTSQVARQEIEAMFEPDTSQISARSLWVLTSLMAARPGAVWFDSNWIVPPTASDRHRRALWEKIDDAWPTSSMIAGAGDAALQKVRVDSAILNEWIASLDTYNELLRPNHSAGLMEHLLALAQINEAAMHLASQQPADAARALVYANELVDPDSAEPALRRIVAEHRPQPGQPLGADGQWAASYLDAGNNNDQKLQLFDAMRQSAGTDLGPIDANLLVREAYRGRTPEIRSTAQLIIVARFASGPNVLLEMLDQLPHAPVTESLSDCIGRVTSHVLPSIRSSTWNAQARAALVERALLLRPSPNDLVDFAATELAASYSRQSQALTNDKAQHFVAADVAAAELVEAWRKSAERIAISSPAPASLHVLAARNRTRNALADGPIQRFVAAQLSVLDLLVYQTVAENPDAHSAAMQTLADSARRRALSSHVLDQAVEVELAIARIWSIRFGLAPANANDAREANP